MQMLKCFLHEVVYNTTTPQSLGAIPLQYAKRWKVSWGSGMSTHMFLTISSLCSLTLHITGGTLPLKALNCMSHQSPSCKQYELFIYFIKELLSSLLFIQLHSCSAPRRVQGSFWISVGKAQQQKV